MAINNLAVAETAKMNLEGLRSLAYADLEQADRHAGLAVLYAARAGSRFLAMKAIVEGTRGYGSWGTWVAANVSVSARTVQFYMQLARSLPALADPDADPDTVMQSAPARELAGLSLRQAMRKLGEPNAKPKKEPEPEPEPTPAPDPRPIVLEWASKQLPLVDPADRGALVDLWLRERSADPLDGQLFEMVCEAWTLGNRYAHEHTPRPSRAGRPPRAR